MMKLLFLPFLLCFSVQALDCDLNFKKLGLCGDVAFKVMPNRKNSSDFTLTFFDAKTKKPQGTQKQVHAYLWMKMKNGHEHGSEKVKIEKKDDAKYLITNVWFLMLGTWNLYVEVKDGDKIIDKAKMDVLVERGNNAK